mmetsp:Transcript_71790/g.155897  ORF Transcript_71790/g.155897 Transcript_71790/m.155897 type:complete len:445 (+) Transcript_71790:58-1392(+)
MATQKIEGEKMNGVANFWTGGASAGQAWMPDDQVMSVELTLDKETTSTLSRRDRRRLRQIQEKCQAVLRLDRARGVLKVTGRFQSVATAAEQIACLSGPRKAVSSAVWAELMRTRLRQDDREDAALARLQKQSGCRIHIDRRVMELRLYGPPTATAAADKLLDEFEEQVTEQTLPLDSLDSLGDREIILQNLQPLADACGVTLRSVDNHVVVLGRHAAVQEAVEKLKHGDMGKTLMPRPRASSDAGEHSHEHSPKSPKKKVPEPSKVQDWENQIQPQSAKGSGPTQWPVEWPVRCPMCHRVQHQCFCTNHSGRNCIEALWPAGFSNDGFSNDGSREQSAALSPQAMMSSMSSAQPGSPFPTFQGPDGSTHIVAVMAPYGAQGMECGSHILVPMSMLSPESGVTAYFIPMPAAVFQGLPQNSNPHSLSQDQLFYVQPSQANTRQP